MSVIGKKLSVIFKKPAEKVVTETNANGTIATQTYFCFPALMIAVAATHNATLASSWFATPNIGQILLMLPVWMKYAQQQTMNPVESNVPGIQSVLSNGL